MHEEHNHSHEHSHDHDHNHNHSHEHEHGHSHEHSHTPPTGDNARTFALLKYMLDHNRQHAAELSAAGDKLRADDRVRAAELIAEAVHYFDHGNEKLRAAIELLVEEG